MRKTWLITGCSSGFGKHLAAAVAEREDNLIATASNADDLENLYAAHSETVKTAAVDVTKPDSVAAVVQPAEAAFGGLDVLVNNAGFGFMGAVEEAVPEEYRHVFETNVFGLIETIRAALPALEKRKRPGGQLLARRRHCGSRRLRILQRHQVRG